MSELTKAKKGITLVLTGIFLTIATFTILIVVIVAEAINSQDTSAPVADSTILIFRLLFAACTAVGVVGKWICSAEPVIGESSRAFARGAAAVDGIITALIVGLALFHLPSGIDELLIALNNILYFLGMFLFLPFLESVSIRIERKDLTDAAKGLRSFIVFTAIVGIVAAVGEKTSIPGIAAITLASGVMDLVVLFRYIGLLMKLRRVIKDHDTAAVAA